MRQDVFGDTLSAIKASRTGQPGTTPYPEITNTDYKSSYWYAGAVGDYTPQSAANACANGIMSLVPFVPRYTHTFTGIGWFHNSAAQNGQNLRLGIYASTGGIPSGAPLVDTGSIATTAAVAFRSATISQQLTAGQVYWLASNADGALTGGSWLKPTTTSRPAWAALGVVDPATAFAASTTGLFAGFQMTSAYGALPTIGTLVDNLASGGVLQTLIMLKG